MFSTVCFSYYSRFSALLGDFISSFIVFTSTACHLSQVKGFVFLLIMTSKDHSGLPRSGKSQGKTKIFQGQGKVREFCKKSGKISVLVKVSEKSGKSQGIFWVLMSGNPVEHEEKNIDGLQKKLKLM